METKKHNKSILDTDQISSLLWRLSVPVFFGMFVQSLYNVISAVFIGQYVGPYGIAALSLAFPLQMMGMGLGMMSGIGGMSLISRFLGSGEEDKAEKALGNGITLAVILSVLIVVGLLPFLSFWLRLMGASHNVLPYAQEYMFYIVPGFVFVIITTSLLNFTRAEGSAKVSSIAMIIGALIDIILCFIFIVWLKMGIKGAGMATLIAQFCSMVYLLNFYRSGKNYLNIRIFTDDPELIKISVATNHYMFLGLPLIGPMHIGTMIFQAIGKAKQAFVVACGRPVVFLLPSAFIWTHFLQLKGVWLAFPSSDVLTFSLVMVMMFPIIKEFRTNALQDYSEA